MEKLILASCSPRRSELLTCAGIPFQTVSPDVDESCDLPAEEAVSVLSARKASAVGVLYPGRFVLAADTLVAVMAAMATMPAVFASGLDGFKHAHDQFFPFFAV